MTRWSKRKRKLSVKQKFALFFVFIILIIGLVLLYLNIVVNPIIIETSASKVRSLSQKCIENVVYEVVKNGNVYDSLIRITRDIDGNVIAIQTNSVEINILAREFAQKAQQGLSIIGETGVNIPLGNFTGMPIFSGRGPKINIKLLPIGTIQSSFRSEFTSAGINQTNHRIYLNATCDVNVILPTASQKVTTMTEIMISECIIVGKIPDVYINDGSGNATNYLDLIP